MSSQVIRTKFEEVILFEPRVFGDDRGYFSESYNQKTLSEVGIECRFVQDNQSMTNKPGVVRGLHFQKNPNAQSKLVRCVSGAILDIVVDIRRDSPTFAQYHSEILSADNFRQLFVPKGFAHGFITLVPGCIVNYKVDEFYSGQSDRSIRWDDPDIGIEWPFSQVELSQKDSEAPLLGDLGEDLF